MTAYYNERDPYAAQWLRNLIAAGHIAPGHVDERSITEVSADDLEGFTQCHFFAGIGVWSHALRRAGWTDDRPVWTGSCPCQPFSAAGQQKGFDDERHLWPVWFDLIRQQRPAIVLGEQVASALQWLDLVSADMEGAGYAIGAADLCAAGFGPEGWGGAHIRQRLYFSAVADTDHARLEGHGRHDEFDAAQGRQDAPRHAGPGGLAGGVADPYCDEREPGGLHLRSRPEGQPAMEQSGLGGLEFTCCERRQRGQAPAPGYDHDWPTPYRAEGEHGTGESDPHRFLVQGSNCAARACPIDGSRGIADWLFCRDGKWRPVEPGTFPLADAPAARVGRLRAYGNAIDAETATQFCGAVIEALACMECAA